MCLRQSQQDLLMAKCRVSNRGSRRAKGFGKMKLPLTEMKTVGKKQVRGGGVTSAVWFWTC